MSLRERKKARLRALLVQISQRLFQEQGFQATTLEQICTEAEIAPQTLLRYFESKQHLALAPTFDGLARFRSELSSPTRADSVLDCWRRLVAEAASGSGLFRYQRLVFETPALFAALATAGAELEDLLAAELARERNSEEGDLRPRMLAALLVGATQSVVREWLGRGGTEPLVPRLLAVADLAEVAFASDEGTPLLMSRIRK
ncbi:MAG TPA: TetR family transcriptional regulator [Acidimicrobiales bacterium]|nr:TetR family transcriptional regulator [Acidimicrobiales bacterium]